MTTPFFASLETEVAVVGLVCFVFLALMVFAGVREIYQDRDR